MTRHSGRCHCGAIRLGFETGRPLSPRACQCGFCRRHGGRTVSDPDGQATLELSGEGIRYGFGTRTTEYIICARCGVYVGAVAKIDGANYATLNLNAFDDPRLDLASAPVSYDGESAAARAERRRKAWTPLRLL